MSILGAINRRAASGRSLVLSCLVVAAALPSGVIAFQNSSQQSNALCSPSSGDSKMNPNRRFTLPLDTLRIPNHWLLAG